MIKKHISLLILIFLAVAAIESLGQTTTVSFTASNPNWAIPAGVTSASIQCWGGGGAGGGVSGNAGTRAGGGGAGGAYVINTAVTVTPASTVAITVGAGGVGANANDGGDGGQSSFGALVTASGGAGGNVGSNATPNGTGGLSTAGDNNGGAGGNAAGNSGGGGGGAGASGDGGDASGRFGGAAGAGGGGAGVNGLTGGGNGTPAAALSAGGSGGRATNNTVTRTGGNGFRGQVLFTYTLPNVTGLSVSLQSTTACSNNAATFVISSSNLVTDTYTITYNIAGASNTVASTTATINFTAGSPGTATFTTPVLSSVENDVLQITRITNSIGNFVDLTNNTNFAVSLCRVWYTYQTGNFSDFNTWTLDPSGTSFDNGLNITPIFGDEITILSGFTVSMDVSNQTLSSTTIAGGGVLDMSTTSGHNLGVVTGAGLLRVKSVALPSGTYTDFVSTLGGTIEYYDVGGTLSTAQTTYNKLKLTNSTGSGIIYILASNLTVNGTFDLSTTGAGTVTWQINDATANQRTIILNGDLTLTSGGRITAGTGNSAGTAHSITMYGNFTNNGIVHFFDAAATPFSSAYTSSAVLTAGLQGNAANVTFSGTATQTVTCNNQTYFYRFIVNKGTGKEALLTVNSSATANFRFYGPANRASTNNISNCALSIANGTLQLTGNISIPTLIEEGSAALGADIYGVPQTGGFWLNGAGVSVTLTSNVGSNNTDQRLAVNGLFKVSNGASFNGGYSRGIGSLGGGSVTIEGANTIVTIWQYRPQVGGTGVFTFNMTGGTLNVGTTNEGSYVDPISGSTKTPPAISGPDDGYVAGTGGGSNTDYTSQFARFSLADPVSAFQMSGGVINIGSPTVPSGNEEGALAGGIDIQSSPANYNVTGGTINMFIPQSNTVSPPTAGSRNFSIYSTAPLYNVNIYRVGTVVNTFTAILNGPLTVLNNLYIDATNTPTFNANGNNLTIGGNFTISAGATFTPGTNTITFNGTGAQAWTHSTTSTITSLNNVIVNKSSGTLTLAGTGVLPNITGSLTLTSGTFADGGKTVTVSGSGILSNSATHTGAGSITYTSTAATIGGTGGTFSNLNINSATATIATNGNQTVGILRLVGANTLNIGSNALTVTGSIYSDGTTGTGGFGTAKRILTSGLHNAGGLTRTAVANALLLFPMGTGGLYTPNSITVNLATTYGTITIRPVAAEHPNVTTTGTSLLYYWRVTSAGFVTTASTTVSHSSYNFSTATKNGTAANYRAARYDRSTNTWAAYGTDVSTTTFINTLVTPAGTFNTGDVSGTARWPAGLGDKLDGEYTCGNIGAFGAVTAYYSKGSGAWNAPTGVWTQSATHSGADLAGPPCATCPVIIGDVGFTHIINVEANNRSCGTLAINTGSTLNCDRYTGLNFGTTAGGAVTGGGILRIGSPNFPSGDFTNFIRANGGTVEWYITNANNLGLSLLNALTPSTNSSTGATNGTFLNVSANSGGTGTGAKFTVTVAGNTITSVIPTQAGSGYVNGDALVFNASLSGSGTGSRTFTVGASNIIFTIPAAGPLPQSLPLATYYNLVLNPASTFTINLPPTNLTVYNNWTQQTGTGTVTNNGARTIAVTGNLGVSDGTFSLTNSGNTNFTVGGSVSNSGTISTTGGTHAIAVTGGITNNGTMTLNNTGTVGLTFTGTSNVSFTGTGSGGTTLSTVTVNKGSSQTPTVLFDVAGTVTATTSGWLTLTNGTFHFNNSGTTTIVSANATYNIPSTAKLKVSAGTVNVLSNANDAADLTLNGALEVSGGTVNIAGGTNGNDIEYASTGSPTIIVSSGALNVNGSIRRSIATLTGALVYNQTGGTVTVRGLNSNNTRGVFEIDSNTGSSFTLTGTSTLNIQRQTGGSGYADVFINPVSSNVSSTSTIGLGLSTVATNTNFRINIAPAIGNFSIAGTNAHVVNMFSNPLICGGSLTIPTPSTLNTNSLNVSVAGDLSCTGTYTGGTNITTFNGTGTQAADLSSSSTFNDVTVSKTAGTTLTLSGTSPVLQNLNILTGILDMGSIPFLEVRRNIINNSSQIGAGYILVSSTAANSNTITSSGGSFSNLTLGGTATSKIVAVNGATTINGTLTFNANRYLMIGSSRLTFSATAQPVAGIGSTSFVRTNGVSSDLGVTKVWGTGTASFVYPIGAGSSYTPVSYSLNVTTSGTLNVVPVNSVHPTYNQGSAERVLKYYWIVSRVGSALVATVSGNHTYSYPASLFMGVGGTLVAGYLDGNSNPLGWTTNVAVHGGTATTTLMTYTTGFPTNIPAAGTSYDYSVGTPGLSGTLPNPIVPLYSRKGLAATIGNVAVGGTWGTASNWTSDADGDMDLNNPSGFIPTSVPVVILSGSRINTTSSGRRAYKTTLNGVLDVAATTGHSLGVVDGTGTFRSATGTFPAGDFTPFTLSTGGTIEYVAPATMNNRLVYNNLSVYSGTPGTVTMAGGISLTINGNVTIPAGTVLAPAPGNDTNMAVAGNWTNGGTFTAGGTSAISITGNLANTGTYNLGSTTAISLTGNLNNSGTYNMGASSVFSVAGLFTNSGTFNQTAGSGSNLLVAGNFVNTGGTFTQTAGTTTFNGSGAQSTTGVVTFYNLTIGKAGNLTLGTTVNVNGALTMSSGNIISNTYTYPTPPVPLLVLGSAATNGGSSSSSFVSGQIRKTILNGQSFTFPVGSNAVSRYRPAKISNTSANDTWDVSYIANSPSIDNYSSLNFNNLNMAMASNFEYWQVANGTGTTKAGLTLSYGTGSYGGGHIGDENQLKTVRWPGAPTSGGPWDIAPATPAPTFSISAISGDPSFNEFVPSDNVKGTVTISNQDLFSPQTLATDDPNSTLPIELLDFTARLVSSSVQLNWTTASELNNDYFVVERASDIEHFEEVAKVKGKGTFKASSNYSLIDNDPLPGISYYRLRQTDFDGAFTYSALRKIENSNIETRFRIYPNPLIEDKFDFELTGINPGMEVPLKIMNLQGISVFEAGYKADQNGTVKASVKLNQVSSGLYIVIVNADLGLRKKIVIP